MNLRPLCLAVAGATLASAASATPFAPYDIRASAMGGVGVASANAASAALFNPALLSAGNADAKSQFSVGIGAHAKDALEMFDNTDALVTSFKNFRDARAAMTDTNTPSPAQLEALRATATNVADRLVLINDDYLFLGGVAGLGVGVPGQSFGFGVTASTTAYADAVPRVGGNDLATLRAVIADVKAYVDSGGTDAIDQSTKDIVGANAANYNVDSSAEATGVLVTEIGVGLSHRFAPGNGILAVGITPKAVDVTTYHYEEHVDEFDDAVLDSTTFEKIERHADLDLGLVYQPNVDGVWRVGLAARNLANQTVTTVPGQVTALPREVSIGTQVRAGVARIAGRSTLAIDLDLTENEGVTPLTETQILAFGAEYAWKYFKLRGGYRSNLADSRIEDTASVGLGLGPLDLSVIGNEDDIGAYAQLAFSW